MIPHSISSDLPMSCGRNIISPGSAFSNGRITLIKRLRITRGCYRIAGAMPDRDFQPWPPMTAGCSNAIAKRLPRMSVLREHDLECLLNVAGAPIGQPRDDGAAGKSLRVRCKHSGSHRAAGREAGDEYFAAVGSKCRNGVLDHLPDRKRLAVATRDVARQKPRETILRIVGGLLLRIDDREAEAVGEGRPAGAVIILV